MRLGVALVAVSVAVAAGAQAPTRTDLLDLVSGAVVISASSSYGGAWGPLNLIDGGSDQGWCSEGSAAFPHAIVVELPQAYAVASVAVDNTNAQDSGYPGISAKGVTVYGSSSSASTGWTKLVFFDALAGKRKEVTLAKPATAQWLKFEIVSNWGNAEYTELMELEAYGEPVGPPPQVDIAGVYETTYDLMLLEQEGSRVWGCYDCCGIGQLTGSLTGRVLQFEWREDEGTDVGTAIMVLSAAGDALNGVYFRQGQVQGEWSGHRAPGERARCTVLRAGGLAERLEATGRAVVYGIYFDSDLANLKPESNATLEEIVAALQAQPSLKLQVAGHTDSTNTDAYNLKLSQQRADAVVAWLVGREVAPTRLTAKGFGEAQPVADNATAAGRALNRRVELVVQR
jgi:outer membrane protein OmpA-like peptidoglycan-associated protein